MNLTRRHLIWYQQQQVPNWGGRFVSEAWVTIDEVVNLNASGESKLIQGGNRDLNNAVNLLRMVRKNMQHDPCIGGLLGYMSRYQQQDGRLKIYRRWSRKLYLRNLGFKSLKALHKCLSKTEQVS